MDTRIWSVLGACSVQGPVGVVGDGSMGHVIHVPKAERSVERADASVWGMLGGWGMWCPCVMSHILLMGCKGACRKNYRGTE